MTPYFPSSTILGERIALSRKNRGLDRNTLAKLAEVPPYQIARIERGEMDKLPFPDIGKICEVLEISIDALVDQNVQALVSSLTSGQEEEEACGEQTGSDVVEQLRNDLLELSGSELISDIGSWTEQGLGGIVLGSETVTQSVLAGIVAYDNPGNKTIAITRGELTMPPHVIQSHPQEDRIKEAFRLCELHRPNRVVMDSLSVEELGGWYRLLQEGYTASWASYPEANLERLLEGIKFRGITSDTQLDRSLQILLECSDADHIQEAVQLIRDSQGNLTPYLLHGRDHDNLLRRERYVLDIGDHSVTAQASLPHPLVVEDPLNPPSGIIPLGEIKVGTNKQHAIGMPVKGLEQNLYLCGSTGSGKSALLQWLTYGLAKDNQSLFLIDPYGSLADNTLSQILKHAPERAEDVVVLDFADAEWPVSFNPISIDSASEIEATSNSVKEMLLKMLNLNPDSTPRALNYVEQAVWAMCECNLRALGGHRNLALTLLQVPDFFTDREFRQLVMQFCTNLSVRSTFDPDGAFEKLGERQQLDHVMPVLHMFSSLASNETFSNVFGQSENKIDLASMVRDNKIVLIKLPPDMRFASFIGAIIIPMLMSSLSKWGHNPDLSTYLIIDEFQVYATESYISLLASARKQGLYGIAANQVPQDLSPRLLRAVQSNMLNKISMRLDPQAVKEIANFIAGGRARPQAEDILALPNYWGWGNVVMDNETSSGPFLFRGLAPPEEG